MVKGFNYKQLMQQGMLRAMHELVAEVLGRVAREGLPGKHHFFINFDTTHPGVVMSRDLQARYPAEMTIVLQEWFADLAVMKDRFTVTLSFGNMAQTIVVPFEAIKTFVDPSVEFGLKFDAQEASQATIRDLVDDAEETIPPPPTPIKPAAVEGSVVNLDKFRKH